MAHSSKLSMHVPAAQLVFRGVDPLKRTVLTLVASLELSGQGILEHGLRSKVQIGTFRCPCTFLIPPGAKPRAP